MVDLGTILLQTMINGFLIYIVQLKINSRQEIKTKIENLKVDSIIEFYTNLQSLNKLILKNNDELIRGTINIEEFLNSIRDKVVDLIILYDTNPYDLEIFKEDYEKRYEKWDVINTLVVNYTNKQLDDSMRDNLSKSLQSFKIQTMEFFKSIRIRLVELRI